MENVQISRTRKEIDAPGSGRYVPCQLGAIKPKEGRDHPNL